ncbi:MAG: phosphotransferase family protein [Pseudomonadota bacterium]
MSKRPEDLLDLDRIDAKLKEAIPGLAGSPQATLLAGGASNVTFALDYEDRSLILRRAPPGTKAKGAHDMIRESRIIAGLRSQFPLVPEVYLQVDDPEVMDTPFFVMERLEGQILRGDAGPESGITPEIADRLCEELVQTWARLHAVDVSVDELSWLDRGEGYVERQIGGWAHRYRKAITPDVGDFETVIAWLEANRPADAGRCLIHNDYRFDNLVLDAADPAVIRGVLDWELATVGCPLMDVGGALAYWVQADDEKGFHMLRLQPTHLPGMWTRSRLVERYEELAGRQLEPLAFYEVYGLFRLAGIGQQIYYRHYHGQFRSERFANFVHVVNYLEQRCLRIIGAADG